VEDHVAGVLHEQSLAPVVRPRSAQKRGSRKDREESEHEQRGAEVAELDEQGDRVRDGHAHDLENGVRAGQVVERVHNERHDREGKEDLALPVRSGGRQAGHHQPGQDEEGLQAPPRQSASNDLRAGHQHEENGDQHGAECRPVLVRGRPRDIDDRADEQERLDGRERRELRGQDSLSQSTALLARRRSRTGDLGHAASISR
jgi:hypothetical protein